ncbi:response regulator transcription factor [Umezawaea sp. Da 62-37]|uniref:response regulator transcription factor n=1 Tax=Umezawaea sp. Da 62-37 TaxID=3075927 RepID=UPI0028F6DDBC|nr:response regulator transcription factor [Umezawaea sp. Da 62-37]WNV90594.1 response regulator transcription factor [Umezawaea sp. Da 62-37]
MPKVLVVEDDPVVQAALVHALTELGHVVQAVGTAVAALREAANQEIDLVLLDLGLPDLDGVAALRMLRGVSNVPVIVATARGAESSIVSALDAGADDYVVKPFSSEHLAARINALLRRTGPDRPKPDVGDVLVVGELRVDVGQREARLAGRVLALSRREFDLLAYLARRPSKVITRRELIQAVWGHPHVGDDKTIDVHASWLRRKLGETAADPKYLHTVRGVGLKLSPPG